MVSIESRWVKAIASASEDVARLIWKSAFGFEETEGTLAPERLHRGEQLPHFEVKTVAGDVFSYSTIWQRKNLVLVTLPAGSEQGSYPSTLAARGRDFDEHGAACVMTRDRVPGVPTPGAVVADRWGEIVHIVAAAHMGELPPPSELLDWLEYVEQRCPECEGEAK